MPETRLTRSKTDRLLAGVCGGLAVYLGIDSVLIRLAFLILLFASAIGVPIYLILWVIMPLDTNVDKPGATVIQENIEEMGTTVYSSVNRLGRPQTVGVLLIIFGAYFLFNQLGWLGGLNSGIFWSMLIIAAGVYWLARNRK